MGNALRIVMLEDQPADAVLVKEELRKGGLKFSFARVETREQFLEQVSTQKPDLILSDHGLPAFDGLSALNLAKEKGLNLPLAAATKKQYDRMVKEGLGELDKSGIAELTFKGRHKAAKK